MRFLGFCGLLVAALLLVGDAAGQDSRQRNSFPNGSVSSGGDFRQGSARHSDRGDHDHGGHHHGHHQHGGHHHNSNFWFNLGFPLYWGGGFTPVFPAYYPPVGYVGYSVFGYTVVVPPVTVVNLSPINAALPAVPVAPRAIAPQNDPAPLPAEDPKPKATNAEHKAKAGRFLGFGDAQFSKQKYLAAIERYKTAAEIAPDMVETYYRQALAHVAVAQYGSAARAFRRGLQVRSNWDTPPFRLDQLYDDAPLAKTHHLEDLARAVEANPFDADVLLVLGMELFFDGQSDRARTFLARSAQLGGNEDHLLDHLLGEPRVDGVNGAQPPQPKQQGGKISF